MMIYRLITTLFILLSFASGAKANIQNYSYFETIPILHEGRIKPLNSFALIELKRISGKTHLTDGTPATQWLAEVLFNPREAIDRPVFKVYRPTLKAMLGLNETQDLFSYVDITPAIVSTEKQYISLIQTDFATLTPEQQALIILHENFFTFTQILNSFSFLAPLELSSSDTPKNIRYLDIMRMDVTQSKTIQNEASPVLFSGQNNRLFKIIPKKLQLVTPWSILIEGQGTPSSAQYIKLWERSYDAYRSGNGSTWTQATKELMENASKTTDKQFLSLETKYNAIRPFFWAKTGYLLSFIFGLLWLISKKPMFWRPALLSYIAAKAFHIIGLSARIIILERPPIATLYETLLFVSLILGLLALFIEWKERKGVALTLGGLGSGLLLLLSLIFIDNADTKPVLSAVLNSNFWLGTHVVIVTAGYGACILTALLSHYKLWTKERIDLKNVRILALLSLTLMIIGTVLGGIWADQSWGRFWGWDPKENGALLIILWLIWILHGDISKQITGHAYNAGLAGLNIIVALSWFGVNFLGIGLHSYGFYDGLFYGLITFCIIQTLVIGGLYLRARKV